MRNNRWQGVAIWVGVFILTITFSDVGTAEDDSRSRSLGRKVVSPALQNVNSDNKWSLGDDDSKSRVVVLYFNSTECPVTNRYLAKLEKLYQEFKGEAVEFATVNSNAHDTAAEIRDHAQEYGLTMEILRDLNGVFAKRLEVSRTAEAIVIDRKGRLRFRGVVDDRHERGVTKPKVTRDFLRDAIQSVLSGREVTKPITDVTACPINFSDQAEKQSTQFLLKKRTYSEHAAAILQRKCQSCHREGGIGPFELTDYDDARSWATSIREVMTSGLMPPWHAESPHGHFMNDRSLTEEEYTTLLDWIDGGCVEGDPAKLPEPPQYRSSWTIGEPDMVATMQEAITVPAVTPEFGVPYKYIWAGKPFEKEVWVKSAEVHPGADEVVHHVIVYIVPEGVEIALQDHERPGGAEDWFSPLGDLQQLASFVPGDNAFQLGEGIGRRIPKGSRLLFEMHYTPNGRKAVDRSEVGMIFADQPQRHEVAGNAALNYWFSVPPEAANHRVRATHRFQKDVVLLSMNPHMHYRGKAFKYELIARGGERSVLLDVPHYSFDWQSTYTFAEPIEIEAGSRIICTATFDNSSDNPWNPDPTVTVTWGEQTWQEMMLGYFEYYEK